MIVDIPDIGQVEFPDSMSDQEVEKAIRENILKQSKPSVDHYSLDPTEGMSTTEKALAGAGKFMSDAWLGAKQLGAEFAYLSKINPDRSDLEKLYAEAEERKRLDQPLMDTTAGKVGYVGGGVLAGVPLMAIPGANTVTGAALTGAAYGATAPITEGESRVNNTLVSTGLGVAGKLGADKLAGSIANRLATKQASKIQNQVRDASLSAGRDAGYVVPPTQSNPTKLNRALEGLSGKIMTGQKASIKNQEITNTLAKRALGLPDDTPLTKDVLFAIREQAGDAYEAIPDALKTTTTDLKFVSSINKATKSYRQFKKEFPKLADADVDNLIESVMKKSFDTKATVEAIKKFRYDGGKNIINLDPSKKQLGRVQKKFADSLEDLLERNLSKTGQSELVSELKASRKMIAKTYSVEKALNESTGNVVAGKIAKQASKGTPFDGDLKTIADFSNAFPKATQEINSSMPGLSPLDYSVALLGAGATGNALGAAGLVARPAARSAILSSPYQSLFASPSYNPGLIKPNLQKLLSSRLGQSIPRTVGPSGLLAVQSE